MARLLGPDANSRLVYTVSGSRLAAAAGKLATVYADAGATQLASIATYDPATPATPGAVISGSTLTVDAYSLLPLFWFPDGQDKVWIRVDGGPLAAVNADYDARLDAGTGVTSVNGHTGSVVLAAADVSAVATSAVGAASGVASLDSGGKVPTGQLPTIGAGNMTYRGAWAPATIYAVNDVITFAGEPFLVTAGFTSGSSFALTNLLLLTQKLGRYNVKHFGAKGDGKSITDMATTSGSATVTSASAAFTAADAGKAITIGGGAGAGATLSTTILSVTNATTVVLNATAGATLANAHAEYGTNDTAAINSCISTAYAETVANGTFFSAIYSPPGLYMLASPTIKGGATFGNAQVPLPFETTAAMKYNLLLSGPGADSTGWSHWEQAVAQRSGAVWKSTLTGQALDGTWGAPSIIGGPTVSQGSGVYSNIKVIIRGMTIQAPYNPSLVGVDLRYCAQAHIMSLACLTDAPVVGSPSITTRPTNDLGMALRMPQNGNNDCALIDDFGCQGWYYGISAGEHLTATRIAIVYFNVGIFFNIGGGSFHGGTILNMSAEGGAVALQTNGTPGASWPLFIGQLAVESVDKHVDDPNSVLHGVGYFTDTLDALPVVTGATNFKLLVVSQRGEPGVKTPPAVPASNTPQVNPYGRDVFIQVTGGTVSAIKLDGTTLGVTSGLIPWPAGRSLTYVYTGAPTFTYVVAL